jgi:hypothetical protein
LQFIWLWPLDLCTKVKSRFGDKALLHSSKAHYSTNPQVIDFIELFILHIGWAIWRKA